MTTKKKQDGVSKDERVRNFATVVYPESAPENWIDILNEYHVACLISPLHNRDIDPDLNIKKPHYHVLIMFEGKKNYETQVKPIFDSIGGVGREYVQSIRGYARYLCHLDNPEKYQYSPSDVRSLAGADYFSIIELPEDTNKILQEIESWIMENNCIYYYDLSNFARMYKPEWHRVLIHNSIHIIYFMRSLDYKLKKRAEDEYIR